MGLNYNSYYKDYAGKTLNWLPMDTEDLYKQNLKNRYSDLQKYKWIDQQIDYTFNSHGFRCDEFTDSPTIMFLGCSLTCGIGLPQDTIWPELVSKHMNMSCANLGIGGGSSDTAFRLAHGWIDIVRPSIVIFLVPLGVRSELLLSNNILNLSPLWHESRPYLDYLKAWTDNDSNNALNKLKNSLAIKQLCDARNIKYIEINNTKLYNTNLDDYARDLAHPGINCNREFARSVLSQLE